jgi:hypothetical protein
MTAEVTMTAEKRLCSKCEQYFQETITTESVLL